MTRGFKRFGVAPETLLLTRRGQERISDLNEQEVDVWTGERFETTTVFKVAENVPLLRITTDTGSELSCSPDHEFRHLVKYNPVEIVNVEARDLSVGLKLAKSPSYPVCEPGDKVFPHAYSHGFYMGTERFHKKDPLTTSRAAVFNARRVCLPYLDLDHKKTDKTFLVYKDTLPPMWDIPLGAEYSQETKLEWLRGLFDGGLCYRGISQDKPRWHVYSEHIDFLVQVKLLVQTLGGDSRVVPNVDLTRLSNSFRISGPTMQTLSALGINLRVQDIPTLTYYRRGYSCPKIKSIEDDYRTTDVYNLLGTEAQAAVFNGLYTAAN